MSRQGDLAKDVVDELTSSLVATLVSGDEARRHSVIAALSGLDVDLGILVETLLSTLEHTEHWSRDGGPNIAETVRRAGSLQELIDILMRIGMLSQVGGFFLTYCK